MRSEIVSDAVVFSVSVSQRAISASEEASLLALFRAPKLFERSSKSDFSECRAKLACALPSAKAFRAKLKDRLLNALQRYALFPTPPIFAPHGAQKSVKKTRTSR